MDLVKVTDGKPQRYSYEQFKRDNPLTGFPERASAGVLEPYGVYPLRTLPMPSEVGKKAVVQALPTLVGTEWVLDWDLVALSADEARALRDELLASTDWTQVSDNTLTDAQREEARTYRTALRNITSSLSNPENVDAITWPTPPSFL